MFGHVTSGLPLDTTMSSPVPRKKNLWCVVGSVCLFFLVVALAMHGQMNTKRQKFSKLDWSAHVQKKCTRSALYQTEHQRPKTARVAAARVP